MSRDASEKFEVRSVDCEAEEYMDADRRLNREDPVSVDWRFAAVAGGGEGDGESR